jgi:all-trans-8'-apo-beta-carotenal 15,15'-oxygenase
MLTRRETIGLMGGAAAGFALGGCASNVPDQSAAPKLEPDRKWLAKLGQGLPEEFDYVAEIEGRLPDGLAGTLYRNGPGLFERDGFKKRTVLDGDGMIRATSFAGGQARFRNRFVRTSKYLDEKEAGEFLYPTWTTPAPGFFDNIPCIPSRSQAGVTPVIKDGVLYAFDELGTPYGLDPATLKTLREIDPYEGAEGTGPADYKAHTKTDGETGDWVLIGQRGRMKPELHVVVKDRTGRQAKHVVQPSPRGSAYFHDFFWAEPYVVFHLHPALLSPLPMLAGFRTFADSLEWRPEQGSILFVVDTTGARAPVTVEVQASWMWHALNAYTAGNTIVADFVGYDEPDHFLGPDASFRAIMQGREGIANAPGTLRRLTIDLSGKQARLETVADGRYEFPFVPQGRAGWRHRYGYVASHSSSHGWFHDGLARIDTDSGKQTVFHFGPGYYVGEPVYVPDPAAAVNLATMEDRGWLLCEVLEGKSEKSFIAVFDAAELQDGPTAKVRLRHHLPMSFHGWWQTA